ncbi:disease resistance protein RGA2-like [Salvia hispanica]|uniref:disease resistance protein RGA2-like n=1 Tax=Salvia hispanica TaxID=49212 RepID=UPI002008FE1F|nr:disease resistance protein RGA2-like [Salvia hispanica]
MHNIIINQLSVYKKKKNGLSIISISKRKEERDIAKNSKLSAERMLGEDATTVIKVLVKTLIYRTKKEFLRVQGLNREAAKLTGNMDALQKFLEDAENRTIPSESVKRWLDKLKEVTIIADNVLDEFNYYLLSKANKPIKPMKQKVLSCLSSSCVNISHSRSMALRIQEINEILYSIDKEAADLGLKEMLATNEPTLPYATFVTDSFTFDPNFIGRDEEVSIIVEKVTSCITTDERVSILAIVGMGGLGKTTLTRKVFNILKEKNLFGSYIWVHVSQIFDPIALLKNILMELVFCSYYEIETESRQDMLKRIQEALNDKSYLLILDDVWHEDRPTWDGFINSLLGVSSINGNVIVVTTRSMVVATTVNALPTYKLEGLPKEDCWSIIKAKTFGEEDAPSQCEAIGIEIAKKCKGLPLAAKVVGGVLHNKSFEEWHSIKDNWLSQDEGDRIRKILKLSFDNLFSLSLKKCFTYCSVFPKGHKIVRQELIELWISEGFLQHDERNDMESVGNNVFNNLVHNSLLVVEERDAYGNVESCVMHNLMHDLASSLLSGADQVRYLYHGVGDGDINERTKQASKYMRTLIFQGEIIETTVFSSFKYLNVLTLNCDKVTELPSSIRKLIYLRHLNISRTQIEILPDWICELRCLQRLYALTMSLRELPSTFEYLINLLYFYIQSGVQLPPRIGRLTNLQALKFRVAELKGYTIEELGSLDNLERLSIQNLEKVADIEEAKKAKLSEKQRLSTLELEWAENGEGERKDESLKNKRERDDEAVAVLEGLEPHQELKVLKIAGFKGERLPSWIVERRLDRLIEITLSSCQEFEEIPTLGQLPNLKFLSLSKLSSVRSINSLFCWTGNSDEVIFPSLESLLLLNMADLSERSQTEFSNEVKVFPRLKSLKIHHCYRLEYLPNWLFRKTHSVSQLDIKHCPMLRALPDGLHALDSLEQLTIRGCRNLKSIAYPSGGRSFPSLRSLEIHDCHELVELVEPSAPLLKKVSVVELKSLQNLPRFLRCLEKSQFLEQLTVVAVPTFMFNSSGYVWPFRRLKKLEIDISRLWSEENRVAINARVDYILQDCHVLEKKHCMNEKGVPVSGSVYESFMAQHKK